jgi:hypothetical protein
VQANDLATVPAEIDEIEDKLDAFERVAPKTTWR